MLPKFEINDEDICYAESILLPQGKTFDHERIEFITNVSTIDLQAVPGSGKTTALLAKLLILERKLPFENGSGVLVLSHTNAAIDEIKERIQQYCPKLFSYPNFIGTIQSFVHEYLVKPFYQNFFNKKLLWIDNEKYQEAILTEFKKIAWNKSYEQPTKIFYSRHIKRAQLEAKGDKNLEKKLVNEYINIEVSHIYFNFITNKIENFKNDFSLKDITNKRFIGLKECIFKVLNSGIITFEYAYILGKYYLNTNSKLISLLQKRFSFVCIDEMQDMDSHQYNLIEKIFFDEGNSLSILQRIGDINQSIYSNEVKSSDVWTYRETVLPLLNSQRLSQPIANIIKSFAVYSEHCIDIQGLNACELKPHLLLFTEESITKVIPSFTQLVQQYKDSGQLLIDAKKSGQIKVICWNTDWKSDEESRIDQKKIRLEDYYQPFKKNEQRPKDEYNCLKSYLHFYDKKPISLAPIRKNILHALLKILRIENINANDHRPFTVFKLMNHLKNDSQLNYDELNLRVYQCAIKTIQGNSKEALIDLQAYIPTFISYFSHIHTISSICENFIKADQTAIPLNQLNNFTPLNTIEYNGLKIEVTSVHSVKGQTHSASLYLESYYYADGKGLNAKSYESQRLANQFLGQPLGSKSTERCKQSAKIAYVGFSRATQLLCIAIHKDRFEQYLNTIDHNLWEIKNVL